MIGEELSADIVPEDGDGIVGIQDLALIAKEWLSCFLPAASDPFPFDGEEDVVLNPEFVWLSENGIIRHDFYFGKDACSVAGATRDSQEYLGSVMDNLFNLDHMLESETVYYWRVDQIGPKCIKQGTVWSFKTRRDISILSE